MTASTTEALASTPESERVCVVGQGYVGLPLSLALDEAGHDVVGYDVDQQKVERLAGGEDVTGDHGDDVVAASDTAFTTDASAMEASNYIIVTVPTPVDDLGNPDLSFVKSAGRTVGDNVGAGTIVVLESTVYPGVTRDLLGPILEERSGLCVGEELGLGYSPERLSPGEEGRGLQEVVKLVGGSDTATTDRLVALYESVVDAGVYRTPSIETAEAAKVLENVQRDVNIALANELSIICDHLDLETQEVLDAAATKWNFHEYEPGLVGGHCIPVDPLYLAHGAERQGYQPALIMQGREINEYMPKHTAELALKALNRCGKILGESEILVLGLAYKPNVGDIRTSEVAGVISELQEFDVTVAGHDPHANVPAARDEFGIEIQSTLDVAGFDGLVLATPHDEYRDMDVEGLAEAMGTDPVLIDVRGVIDPSRAREAGLDYERL